MTIIEKPAEVLASIDPFFSEDDHFVCCEIPSDFVGSTTTFCGKVLFDASLEAVAEVDCGPCMVKAYGSPGFCPLKGECSDYG